MIYCKNFFAHTKYNKSVVPKYKDYRDCVSRIKSFNYSDTIITKTTIELLATSGFFYNTITNCATCFHCGGILLDYVDSAINEHVLFFPECRFINHLYGPDYLQYAIFKKEIVKQQWELYDLINKKKRKTRIVCPTNVSFDDFKNVKNLIRYFFRKITNENDLYEIYLDSESFFLDYNKIFIYLFQIGYLKLDTDLNNCSIFCLSKNKGNDKLKIEENECIICFSNLITVVFLPCNHKISCFICANKLNNCPICRTTICQKIKI